MILSTMKYVYLGGACEDCVAAIFYDNYSVLSVEQRVKTRRGLKRVAKYLVVGDEQGFSSTPCVICEEQKGGTRHEVGYHERKGEIE